MKTIKTLLILLLLLPGCKKEDIPTVKTGDVASITRTTASCSGEILSQGDSEVTERGICWSTTDKPLISDNIIVDDSDGNSFTVELTGLEPGTEYFVRAYATNRYGTGYGEVKAYTTDPLTIPEVITYSYITVTQTTAVFRGKKVSDGGSQYIDFGFCWSKSDNPTLSDDFISVSAEDLDRIVFLAEISTLEPGTRYYMRSYATNLVGNAYSETRSFSTCSEVPNMSIIGNWQNDTDPGCGHETYYTSGTKMDITADSVFNHYYRDVLFLSSTFRVKPGPDGYDTVYFNNPQAPRPYYIIKFISCNNLWFADPREHDIVEYCHHYTRN